MLDLDETHISAIVGLLVDQFLIELDREYEGTKSLLENRPPLISLETAKHFAVTKSQLEHVKRELINQKLKEEGLIK